MLATSRVNRTCVPLAEMSIFSLMLAPLNSSVSLPAWPSTVSLPSPGFQTNVSSPAPSKAVSLPRPPMTRSLPWLPMIMSSPSPPLSVRLTWPALRPEALMVSLPPRPLTVSESRAPSAPAIVTGAGRPVTTTEAPLLATVTVSSPAGAVDDDGVGRPVALAAARRRRQVEVDLRDGGAGQVVDGDGVGAAQGVELDVLDAVEVHGDVGDVAGEPHAAAVGRDVDLLGDVGAVEQQRVGAGLALDDVAAVAGVPDEGVVAGAEQGGVVAAAADRRCRCRRRRSAGRRPGCR